MSPGWGRDADPTPRPVSGRLPPEPAGARPGVPRPRTRHPGVVPGRVRGGQSTPRPRAATITDVGDAARTTARGRLVHRALIAGTVLAVGVDLVLLAAGRIDRSQAVVLLVCVELPLTVLAVGATWRCVARARRRGAGVRTALAEVVGPTPLAVAETELQSLRAVALIVRGRRSPAGHPCIPYGRGLLGTVVAFCCVAAVEVAVLHLLIPVPWVRTALTVLGLYAFVVVLGLVLSRVVYPHYVEHGRLHLRQGSRRVLTVDLGSVTEVATRRRIDVVGLYPGVRDSRLCLPSQDGTNLDLVLADEVRVEAGVRRRDRRRAGGAVRVRHVSLHVDDPEAARALVLAERARITPS